MTSSLITDLPKGIVPSGRRAGASRLIGEIVVDLGLASREDVEAAVAAGARRGPLHRRHARLARHAHAATSSRASSPSASASTTSTSASSPST